MGFFDIAKQVSSMALNALDKKHAEIKTLESELEELDDDTLLYYVKKNHKTSKGGVAFGILKSRGYTPEQIGEMVKSI